MSPRASETIRLVLRCRVPIGSLGRKLKRVFYVLLIMRGMLRVRVIRVSLVMLSIVLKHDGAMMHVVYVLGASCRVLLRVVGAMLRVTLCTMLTSGTMMDGLRLVSATLLTIEERTSCRIMTCLFSLCSVRAMARPFRAVLPARN